MKNQKQQKEERIILTSENCPELAAAIEQASKEILEENFELYKALENK